MSATPSDRRLSPATKWKLAMIGLIALPLIAFLLVNLEVVEVNLLFAKVEMRRAFFIIISVALGFSLGWLMRSLRGNSR